MNIIKLMIFCILITGCTDTERGRWGALGNSAEIVCYSGGKEIYRGISTGKVGNASQSDGYEFVESVSNKLIRINADCIVRN